MFRIDPTSACPPYRQVRDQIVAARERGEATDGYRLPPVRTLAKELGLAPNTVARAYRELESAGVIVTRGRHGTFVVGKPQAAKTAAREAARRFLREIQAMGLEPEDATRALRKVMKATVEA